MFQYLKENPTCVLWLNLTLWNKCNMSMHINSNRKKEKKKKKEGNIQFTTFRNTCNITDIVYDYN